VHESGVGTSRRFKDVRSYVVSSARLIGSGLFSLAEAGYRRIAPPTLRETAARTGVAV
jgi:hypothetical protein